MPFHTALSFFLLLAHLDIKQPPKTKKVSASIVMVEEGGHKMFLVLKAKLNQP